MVVTGPLGQRDSSGTGSAGYRVHATLAGEVQVEARADPDTGADLDAVASADAHADAEPTPTA